MGILDDSSDESSLSDYGSEDEGVGDLPFSKNNQSTSSVLEGDVEERLATLMKLKDDMGISKKEEKEMKEKEAHKKTLLEERAAQQQKEHDAVKDMDPNERIHYRKARAFSMMNKIKLKHDTMKQDISDSGHTCDTEDTSHTEEEDEMAEFKRLKALKEAKKKKKKAGSKNPKRSSEGSKSHKNKKPGMARRTVSEGAAVQ